MVTHCPACYCRNVYCRKCKTYHCHCSWAQCPKKKKKAGIAGWQPIETAPKDREVLLWFGCSALPRVDIGRWAERGIYAEGWRCDTHQFNPLLVTHWMPLPDPPRAGEAREETTVEEAGMENVPPPGTARLVIGRVQHGKAWIRYETRTVNVQGELTVIYPLIAGKAKDPHHHWTAVKEKLEAAGFRVTTERKERSRP